MEYETSYSDYHSQLESRLGTLETNAFTFVAVVVSVFVGLGVVYTEHATLLGLFAATSGAILVLGFGAFYIQATTHAFRSVQLVMSRLEAHSALGLSKSKCIPRLWCPDDQIKKGGTPSRMPEMLKVQSFFYLALAIAVVLLLWLWAYRHRIPLLSWKHSLLLATPVIEMAAILFGVWMYANYLNAKQLNLLNDLEQQRTAT
jgi:hypothetical protein